MLYWLKLLVTAYAITNTIEAFIPLYLINQLQLTSLPVSLLVALVYILRLLSGIWTFLVDHRIHLYGLTIALLTTASIISALLLFTLTDLTEDDVWIWTLLIISCLFNGLFYQPLGSLIDSAIIKTLGDYRVLFYGSYVRWSKTTTIVMTGLIGLLIQKEEQLNYVLLSIFILGTVLLLLVALFGLISVEPANAQQLNISDEQAPLLLKNALHLTADQNSTNFPAYRPYSIFGEQLSHISEEDASQLDRMFTNTEESIRPMDSYDSMTTSFYSNTGSYLHHHPSSRFSEGENNNVSMTIIPTVPYNALALLPLPTPTDPLVAFFSWMRPAQNLEDELLCCGHYNNYYYIQQSNQKINLWKTQTLSITLLLLGISHALMNTFLFVYVYSILEMSIYMITCLIMAQMTSEMIVSSIIEKWFIHRLNLTLITTCVHVILIVCAILYPCLKPDHVQSTQAILLVLQVLQATAFQLIWLSGADKVNLIHWSQYDRMKLRSKISALYSSIGPAIGVIIAGYILHQSDQNLQDYTLTFNICVILFSLSFVVSWGWTSDD